MPPGFERVGAFLAQKLLRGILPQSADPNNMIILNTGSPPKGGANVYGNLQAKAVAGHSGWLVHLRRRPGGRNHLIICWEFPDVGFRGPCCFRCLDHPGSIPETPLILGSVDTIL